MLNVSLRSFGTDNFVCHKRLVVERNRGKFGPRGMYLMYTGYF